jgi:Rps23 Pro-64 3,4-dihydroxylase Tpa1-like proline 4-hydroxylase
MTEIQEARESHPQRLVRQSKNSLVRLSGFWKKSDKLAKKQIKQADLKARKRQFGEQYMDLLEKDADPEELENCLNEALRETEIIRNGIDALEASMELVNAKTREKILPTPESPAERQQMFSAVAANATGIESTNVELDKDYVAVVHPAGQRS